MGSGVLDAPDDILQGCTLRRVYLTCLTEIVAIQGALEAEHSVIEEGEGPVL